MSERGRVELVSPLLPAAEELLPDLRAALESKHLTNDGPFVRRLERQMETLLGVSHVVAVSSCTSGLMAAIRALGWRGEVVLPAFTFPGSAHAVTWAGCEPVLADVDPQSFLLDPASVARVLGPETVGILAVDLFGARCDVQALQRAAPGVPILSDAAHALGAHAARARGARAEVYSLHPTKTLVAGEGGLVATDDTALAERVRRIVNFGFVEGFDCAEVGLNAKLPELSAILAWHQARFLEETVAGRRRWDAAYRAALAGVPGVRFQELPPGGRSNFQYTVVLIDEAEFGVSRDTVMAHLLERGVVARPYFGTALHRMRCYAGRLRHDASLAVSETLAASALCLPVHAGEPAANAERIAGLVRGLGRAPGLRTEVPAARPLQPVS